jgi:hypothetical protein
VFPRTGEPGLDGLLRLSDWLNEKPKFAEPALKAIRGKLEEKSDDVNLQALTVLEWLMKVRRVFVAVA